MILLNNKTVGRMGKRRITGAFRDNAELLMLAVPGIIYFFIFQYLPMGGLVLAFKRYTYTGGIFGSPWVGFKNFELFFKSGDMVRIIRNTMGYSIIFLVVGTVVNLFIALMLYEVTKRILIKTYQTLMILPNFISWVLVSFITYIFLHPEYGVLNRIITACGGTAVSWYSDTTWWPVILTVVHIWKGVGMGCLYYYAALLGIDKSLYEAADIDGATKLQKIFNISLPSIAPIIAINIIMGTGSFFRGDFGLFYQIPRDVGALYPVTDIIDTYVYRGIRTGDIGATSAIGFIQSFVGLVMVCLSNWVVRKIDEENSMF